MSDEPTPISFASTVRANRLASAEWRTLGLLVVIPTKDSVL
jgi:hypothetical protein